MVSIIKSKLSEKRTELARAKSLNKNESGVTIVELMIVVAVAALLLVLVLVAAPALQRSGANTTRRNDIGAIRGQIQAAATSNNGALPAAGAVAGGFDKTVLAQIKPGLYNVKIAPTALITGANAKGTVYYQDTGFTVTTILTYTLPNPDSVHIIVGWKCGTVAFANGNLDSAATNKYILNNLVVATSRVFAIIYQLEGEDIPTCEDSS